MSENRPAGGIERSLPANLEAERSILGAILLHNDAFETANGVLGANDFYRDAHRRIYAAMDRLLEWKGGAIDLTTLKAELNKRDELDEVGGPAYITALVDGVPRSMNVRHYAEIVKEMSRLRALIFASNKVLSQAYAAEQTSAEILTAADKALIDIQSDGGPGRMLALRETRTDLMANLEWRVAHRGKVIGIDTGYPQINELTLGWQDGDVDIIAARPSIGKTTFVMNTAIAAAKLGKRVAVFSYEMKRQQLEYRMLSALSGVPFTRIVSGHLMGPDWVVVSNAVEQMDTLHIHIDDQNTHDVWDIRSACRRMKSEDGLDLVVIDYVQLIPGSLDRRGANRNDEVTDISRRLKTLADEVSVPILLLSQLSRANEKRNDPRPKLSDLRESGALEQDADAVMFLHRKNHREGGLTNFIVEKDRDGPTGTVNLSLDRETLTFTDAPDLVEAPPPPPKEKAEKKRKGED